jgi:hypothetical protein
MTNDQKLQKLILFLESKNITVKSDRGNFKGGLVRYYQDDYLYLNRKWDTEAKIKLILKEIKELNFDEDEIDEDVLEMIKYA